MLTIFADYLEECGKIRRKPVLGMLPKWETFHAPYLSHGIGHGFFDYGECFGVGVPDHINAYHHSSLYHGDSTGVGGHWVFINDTGCGRTLVFLTYYANNH